MTPEQQKALALAAARKRAQAPVEPPAAVDPEAEGGGLGRQLGLTGRYLAQGAAGTIGMAYDPIAYLQNKAFGTDIQPLREQVKNALTELGVPEPDTATERVIGAISEGMVGAGAQAKAAGAASDVLTGGAKQVTGSLAAAPASQVVGGGGAGAGAQTVAEAGGGAGAQIGAAVLGGALGGKAGATDISRRSTALPEAVREAEKTGIRVMTSDVMPPTNFASRWLQRAGEMIPVAGTGGPRAAQQAERVDASADLLRNYGVAEVSAADNSTISAVARDLLTKRGDKLNKYVKLKTDVIESVPAGPVDVTKTLGQIDQEIARLESISPTQFKPVIDRLNTWKEDLAGKPLPSIEVLRKQIGESFKDPSLSSIKGEGEKVLNRIYKPLREDMGDYIKANGTRRDYDKWNIANKQLSNMAGEMQVGVMKTALSKGEATPEVVRSMLFSAKPSDVKLLYKNLTLEGRRNARTAVLQEAFGKAGANFENLSPDQFKRSLVKLGSPIGVFFSGDDLKAVEGLKKALSMTVRGGQASVSPPTGVQGVPILGGMFLTDLMGGAGAATVTGGTLGGLTRVYESKPVRNLLMKLPDVKSGTPEETALINRLSAALRAKAATEE